MGLTGFNKRRREAAALAAKLAAESSKSTVSPQPVKAEDSVETPAPTHAVGKKKKVVADESTETV